MKKKTIVLITLITIISLAGILLTQIYWVNTAYKLKEKQFDNSVRIALKSVINQFAQNKTDSAFQKKLLILSCRKDKLSINDFIDYLALDSLLSSELTCMNIKSHYVYGIYSNYSKKFVLGKYTNNRHAIVKSPYQFSLSSIYKPGNYFLGIYFSNKTEVLLQRMKLWVFLSILFLLILIVSLIFVIFTIFQQKKISEIKTNFINNMTHEFKTPIATTNLAAEMLQREEIILNPHRIKKYASIILDENSHLQNQVEQILQVAMLESSNHQFKIGKVNMHDLLDYAANSFELQITKLNIDFKLNKTAENPCVMGDEVHLLNLISNLIENAIKYTTDRKVIVVTTWNENKNFILSVKDNGIGISKEHQQNIFKNLFRVPTGDIQEVRGFGLGLYYVKTIVSQFNGRIELTSEIGEGSDFKILFPYCKIK